MFGQNKRVDPVFGPMIFMGDRLGYWEASAVFPPTRSIIEIFVYAGRNDELHKQHEFFDLIIREWPRIHGETNRLLIEEWSRWKERPGFEVQAEGTFRVSSLSVKTEWTHDAVWSIGFETHLKPEFLWTVQMKGLAAVGVTADD